VKVGLPIYSPAANFLLDGMIGSRLNSKKDTAEVSVFGRAASLMSRERDLIGELLTPTPEK
jgi:hypothetical protein